VQRTAASLHEKLCRPDVQVRVSDVHEILREEIVKLRPPQDWKVAMKKLMTILAALAMASISVEADAVAAEDFQKLSGAQIRAKFTGMQLTDEVHWRYVYDRDGTLRSYAMGTKKVGKWAIEKDELCLYLKEPDDGCFEVSLSGKRIEMTPSGLGLTFEGVLQTPADRN
jgi:hypothetical protein